MRSNRMIFLQMAVAVSFGLGVMYLQKRVGGPVGGIVPGVLGIFIGWLLTTTIAEDIASMRRWLLRRRASRELQPK